MHLLGRKRKKEKSVLKDDSEILYPNYMDIITIYKRVTY